MIKILFFILLCFSFNAKSYAAIEIFSAGRYFSSFEDYKKMEQGPSASKLKDPEIPMAPKSAPILDAGQQKLSRISYNNGVHRVIVNFDQNWQNPKPRFIVHADELEYAIQEAMENQHQPTLLISDPNKLRIMSYNFSLQPHKMDKMAKK